ncbi:MAG: DUF86 domain-containing protein [Phycisphaeraceae bacterium]|nr:DUF86 domain-containing protein [Phycisphaeraceae bacterium]
MSRHDVTLRLRDMLHHAQRAHDKVTSITRDQFEADEDLRAVVAWHLLIVGEAAARVDADHRNQLSHIPWERIIGMRNRLVHEYGNIDVNVVWTTATQRLPELIKQLKDFLGHD